MIEDFVNLIPQSLIDKPGWALSGGRKAFESPSDLYILGDHPGGNPEEETETVRSHTNKVLNSGPDWSEYRDKSWAGKPPGSRPMQIRMQYLCDRLGLSPGEVPGSNLIFQRWEPAGEPTPEERRRLASDCWPFHRAAIDQLRVRVVVCLRTGVPCKWVCDKLGALPTVDKFTENNERRWTSLTYKNADGLYVVALSYPGRADWTNPATDPTELVVNAIARARNSQ